MLFDILFFLLFVWFMVFVLSVGTRIMKNFFPSFQGTTDFFEAWNRSKEQSKIIDRNKNCIDRSRMCGRSTPSDIKYTDGGNKIHIDNNVIDTEYTIILQIGDHWIEVNNDPDYCSKFTLLDNPPDPTEITTIEPTSHPELDK